jgi:hypothetical protein
LEGKDTFNLICFSGMEASGFIFSMLIGIAPQCLSTSKRDDQINMTLHKNLLLNNNDFIFKTNDNLRILDIFKLFIDSKSYHNADAVI